MLLGNVMNFRFYPELCNYIITMVTVNAYRLL